MTYSIIHEQAVSIRTNILLDTTFLPIDEVTIAVDKIPKSLDGVITLQWTETKTYQDLTSVSSMTSAPESISTGRDSPFVLLVMGSQQHNKRRSGSYYVSANGTIANDYTSSPIYTIQDGELTATMNNVVYTYSTSTGVPYAPFVPMTVPGNITTAFSHGSNQALNWWNTEFFNGEALFCALSNGTVHAVFQENSQPEGCL